MSAHVVALLSVPYYGIPLNVLNTAVSDTLIVSPNNVFSGWVGHKFD